MKFADKRRRSAEIFSKNLIGHVIAFVDFGFTTSSYLRVGKMELRTIIVQSFSPFLWYLWGQDVVIEVLW